MKKKPNYTMFKQIGPHLPMDPVDWFKMSQLDQMVYMHLKRRNYSAEVLKQKIGRGIPLEEIWKSLDSELMRKYVFRKSKLFWGLITVYQEEMIKL